EGEIEVEHTRQQVAIRPQPGDVAAVEADEEVGIVFEEVELLLPYDLFHDVDEPVGRLTGAAEVQADVGEPQREFDAVVGDAGERLLGRRKVADEVVDETANGGVSDSSGLRVVRDRQAQKWEVGALRLDAVFVERLAKPFDAADEPEDTQAEA